jgi:HSP20 family protein
MAISRWEPGRGALSLSDAVKQLVDESIWWPGAAQQNGFGLQVPMDVYLDGDRYVVEAALPGLSPEDVNVEMSGTTMTISGEYQQRAAVGRQYLTRQRPQGRFQASITLPEADDAANVTASYTHGVLRIEVPRSEAARPKRIPLKADR